MSSKDVTLFLKTRVNAPDGCEEVMEEEDQVEAPDWRSSNPKDQARLQDTEDDLKSLRSEARSARVATERRFLLGSEGHSRARCDCRFRGMAV